MHFAPSAAELLIWLAGPRPRSNLPFFTYFKEPSLFSIRYAGLAVSLTLLPLNQSLIAIDREWTDAYGHHASFGKTVELRTTR